MNEVEKRLEMIKTRNQLERDAKAFHVEILTRFRGDVRDEIHLLLSDLKHASYKIGVIDSSRRMMEMMDKHMDKHIDEHIDKQKEIEDAND